MIFAAAVSLVTLCFAALTVPRAPEPAVPLHTQSKKQHFANEALQLDGPLNPLNLFNTRY
jgi:hypothetical protein